MVEATKRTATLTKAALPPTLLATYPSAPTSSCAHARRGPRKKDLRGTHPGPPPHHSMHATSVARLFSPPSGRSRAPADAAKGTRAATSFLLLLLLRAFSWPLHMEWIDPRSEPGPLAGRRAAVSLTDQGPSSLSLLWHSGQSISPSNASVLVRSGWRCVSR